MAFRNRLSCYVCNNQFAPRVMARIDGAGNANKCQIAIERRTAFDRPPLDVTPLTRICINCNQSILNEIGMIEHDPTCIRINVIFQTRNSTCLICNANNNLHRLTEECKANVFIQRNIFFPETVRSCEHHLDSRGYLL